MVLFVVPRDVASLSRAIGRLLDEPGLAARLAAVAQQRARSDHAPAVVAERVARVSRGPWGVLKQIVRIGGRG